MSRMDNSNLEKKFLLQKNVLDSMRAYIDLNDEFLEKLCKHGIFSGIELTEIQHLPWPRNRNVFLQYLVRKPWSESLLQTFMEILKETQEEHFVGLIHRQKEQFFKDEIMSAKNSKRHNQSHQLSNTQHKHSAKSRKNENDLDKLLTKKNLTISDQNAVRRMLNDRDKDIFQLKIENQELRTQLKEALAENATVKHRIYVLDRAVCDLLACVDWDVDARSVTLGLSDVKAKLIEWKKTIAELHQLLNEHMTKEEELKGRVNALAEDNATLRSLKAEVETQLSTLEVKYKEDTEELSQMLEEEKDIVIRLKARQSTFETRYRSAITDLQDENRSLKLQLEETNNLLQMTGKENAKFKDELHQINNKTRKLLVSLDLQNEVDDVGVSLDFARNISYAKRKQSMGFPETRLAPLKLNGNTSLVSSGVISSSGSEETSSSRSNLKQRQRKGEHTVSRKISVGTPLVLAGSRNGLKRNSMATDKPLDGFLITSSRK